jgi:hypothetical protein
MNDNLEEQIKQAYATVIGAGIKEEGLQVAAFNYLLNASQTSAGTTGKTTTPQPDQDDTITRIANGIGIDYEIAELFYDATGEELDLHIPVKALPDTASAAMRDIAILLSVGRKHAGLGASTAFDLIRAACDENGKLDKKNFAAAMSLLKPKLVPTGKGTAKELTPKRPADDLAKEILVKYNNITA